MKKKISTAALAFLLLTATAFGFDTNRSAKEVMVDGSYQKITVGPNIKLVLVPADQQTTVTVTGDESKVNDVTVKMNKNEMVISSKKNVRIGSIVVYVPVTDLSYIDLKRGASVSGRGSLTFKDLTVFVNVDSRMELKMIGNINIKQASDCDFIYEKKETAKVVYVKE